MRPNSRFSVPVAYGAREHLRLNVRTLMARSLLTTEIANHQPFIRWAA